MSHIKPNQSRINDRVRCSGPYCLIQNSPKAGWMTVLNAEVPGASCQTQLKQDEWLCEVHGSLMSHTKPNQSKMNECVKCRGPWCLITNPAKAGWMTVWGAWVPNVSYQTQLKQDEWLCEVHGSPIYHTKPNQSRMNDCVKCWGPRRLIPNPTKAGWMTLWGAVDP